MIAKKIWIALLLCMLGGFGVPVAGAQDEPPAVEEAGADEDGPPMPMPPPEPPEEEAPAAPAPNTPEASPQPAYVEPAAPVPGAGAELANEPSPEPQHPDENAEGGAVRPGAANTSRPMRNVVRPGRPPFPRPNRGIAGRMPTKSGQPEMTPGMPMADREGEGASSTPTVSEKGITFDFQGVGLLEVIQKVAALTGKNFDVDPNIADTPVTLITHNEIPVEMAYQVLESILTTRGFALVPTLDGHLIKVMASDLAINSEKNPLQMDSKKVERKSFDDYSTHVFTVEYADATELSTALKLLGTQGSRVDAYAPTNTLIITDTADGLRRMFAFLDVADVPGFDTITEIFTLEYSRAEILASQLEQVLLDTGGGKKAAAPAGPTRVPRRPQRAGAPAPGGAAPQVIGSRENTLRMVPDERLNALIVVATEGMMEQVRDLIARLDTPTPFEANNLHVYELMNADVEKVEEAIRPLVGGSSSGRSGGGRGGAQRGGRGAAGAGAGGNAARPQTQGGGGAAADVQAFEQPVYVSRYEQTNSLLVVASPQDYKILESFIARLDVPQRQVLVDAVVMDVTISNDYGVSVNAASISGNDAFGMTDTSNLSTLAAGLATSADAATSIVGGPSASLLLGVLNQGSGGGMTAGVYDDIKVSIGGQKIKVPFVPLLFKAIETVSDLEVLSRPSLLTADNEEGSIVVGQEVPFITNTSRPGTTGTDGGSIGGFGYGYTRIQREEVGVKLTVTPQISEGDNLLLQIEIEVSDVANQGVGDVNILGPTTNKALMKNKVLVKDGSTAVLAGLIRDTSDRNRKQPPILGDVPGLGWLFRTKTNNQKKRNMVVLVTPHIVKENVDMDRVTRAKVEDYQNQNVEQLFQQNFFRKVKMKSKMRKDYRPTQELTDSLMHGRGEAAFDRGEIKR